MNNLRTRLVYAVVLSMLLSQVSYAAEIVDEILTTSDRMITSEGRWDKSTRIIQESLFQVGDLKDIVMYPYENKDNTLYFLGGLGALILFDKSITGFYQDKIEPIFSGYKLELPDKIREQTKILQISDEAGYLAIGVSGSYILGVGFNNDKMQESSLLAGKAMAYSYLVSHLVLKSLIARKRPVTNLNSGAGETRNYTTNPYDFGYYHTPGFGTLQYGTAMPSFHFTAFFAAAKVYQKVYDNYWLPYSIMALGLTSNITAHRHWVSDMVAGALIGTLIGDKVVENAKSGSETSLLMIPVLTSEKVGASIQYHF